MLATRHAVRVYASSAYVGDWPEGDVRAKPIIIDPCRLDAAGTQGRAQVYLGKPVPWVVEAGRIRQAIGRLMLKWFTGTAPGADPERAIEEAMREIARAERLQDDWHVTIVVEQDIEIPDEEISNTNKYVWLDAYRLVEDFAPVATRCLNRLAVLASTVVVPDAFGDTGMGDRIFFSAPGRVTFGLPESQMTAKPTVRTLVDALDHAQLEALLQNINLVPDAPTKWLSEVTYWWLAGLAEEDTWRAFMLHFTGLELLHGNLARQYYDTAVRGKRFRTSSPVERANTPVLRALMRPTKGGLHGKAAADVGVLEVTPRNELSERGEFAVLALALFSNAADADFAQFDQIKRLRNDLVHGKRQVEGTPLPSSELRDVFRRYLDAAVEDHMRP